MLYSTNPSFVFQLYTYENEAQDIIDPRFEDRLAWNGSKHTKDLQDGSIYILNVTFNDTGTYKCIFHRILTYPNYEYHTETNKTINMNVVPRRKSSAIRSPSLIDMEPLFPRAPHSSH